jgi:hypothetical protein
MPECRRILLDGAAVQVTVEGDELVAADGRRVKTEDAQHLPPVVPSKVIAVHLNHRSRVDEFDIDLPDTPSYFPQADLGSGSPSRERTGGIRRVPSRRARPDARRVGHGAPAGICRERSAGHYREPPRPPR